jgi:small subunit ribosomal protein S18
MMIKKRKIRVPRNCIFCKEKKEPTYKDVVGISKFLTERARIIGKDRSALCAKHQRKAAREIKRARHLAMLPFVSGL